MKHIWNIVEIVRKIEIQLKPMVLGFYLEDNQVAKIYFSKL